MNGDKIVSQPSNETGATPTSQPHEGLGEWLSHNVVNPFVNGTGAIQIYDTLADKPLNLLPTDTTKTGHLDWMAQTIGQTAGAIVPFVVAGKVAGAGMGAAADRIGVDTLAGKILSNSSVAQIVGAGAYTALEKPADGETRLGNAAGTMASFAVFEGGNNLLRQNTAALAPGIAKAGIIGLGRVGVGALGGLTSYETTNSVSNLLGENNKATLDGAIQSMASGGFMNFALPTVQEGVGKVIDYAKTAASPVKVTEMQTPSDTGTKPNVDAAAKPVSVDAPTRTSNQFSFRALRAEVPGDESSIAGAPGDHKQSPVAPKDAVQQTAPTDAIQPAAPTDATRPIAPKDAPQQPFELGATVTDTGINFAVASQNATKINVLLFDKASDATPSQVIPMTREGNTWSANVDGLKNGQLYLYSADGPYTPTVDGNRFNPNKGLLDPYAKAITGSPTSGESTLGYDSHDTSGARRDLVPSTVQDFGDMPKSVAYRDDFKWNDTRPNTPMTDSVIYELNVRGFTGGDESLGKLAGTYAGLKERIPYLKDLGVTAVELLPVHKFLVNDSDRVNPVTGEKLKNAWGYNTLNFFSPEESLAATGTHGEQITEFKNLVQAMHDNGIEVILDVVYNHSGEGNQDGPTLSFRGLDNAKYYQLDPNHPENYVDHTGVGNTMNTNDPQTMKMMLDSMRYWVNEMHVDGFRFDLAPIFKYMPDGTQLAKPPIQEAMESDPVLSKVKLIAEPWSIDQYYMGRFASRIWGEWNDMARDDFRKFVKSDDGQVSNGRGGTQSLISAVADRIAGSTALFDESTGHTSVNFTNVHDGFTMYDTVSYNNKHNEPNGENNRDGSDSNNSWNSGYEGNLDNAPLSDEQKAAIEHLRTKQMKNLLLLLMVSRGTPMLLYGDEIRRTQNGDNNAYNQEKLNQFDWSSLDQNADMHSFNKQAIKFRLDHHLGRTPEDGYEWHGTEPDKPDFSDGARVIALTAKAPDAKPIYYAYNAYWEPVDVQLPPGNWKQLVNSDAATGQDIVDSSTSSPAQKAPKITLPPRTTVIFEQQPDATN